MLSTSGAIYIPRKTIESGNIRSPETCHFHQRESCHVTLLNLNLGSRNRQPLIGGNVRFPKHFRDDPDCVVSPHLALRNGAHIISLFEASDDKGGMQRHEELARENAMLGMVVHAETSAQSIGLFIRGTHDTGNFIELYLPNISMNRRTKMLTRDSGRFTVAFSTFHSATLHPER